MLPDKVIDGLEIALTLGLVATLLMGFLVVVSP